MGEACQGWMVKKDKLPSAHQKIGLSEQLDKLMRLQKLGISIKRAGFDAVAGNRIIRIVFENKEFTLISCFSRILQ
jgi:hypothetical protein